MLKKTLVIVLLTFVTGACVIVVPPSPGDTPTPLLQTDTHTPLPSPLPPTETATLQPSNTPPPVESPPAVSYGPSDFPANVNPLTGLSVVDPSLLERRPLSVKVQIFPRGQRPPMGISLADIVYDYYQNNGLTRFHAIFYGQNAEQVGPIRSGRLFDSSLVRMYKSILAFGGADRRILNKFLNSDFANRLVMEGYGNCPPMCRIDPNGFNFLVTNTAELSAYAISKGIDNSRQDLNGMVFHSLVPAGGSVASQVVIRYSISSYNRWDYDPASGKYVRYQDTTEAANIQNESFELLVDKFTGQRIEAANVVILFLPHEYAYRSQSGNSEIVDIILSGSGRAYALRDGAIFELAWNRPNRDSVLFLTFPDGSLYPFKPGNTWFQVIGQSSKVEVLEGGLWRFTFSIP